MTMAVRMAPTGSLTIASHFRNEAERRSSRAWRRCGKITVGPGHYQDGAEHGGRAPERSADQVGGERSQHEVDGQRDGGEPQHALAGGPKLAEIEREPSLEHHDGHGQADQRAQVRTEGLSGVEQPEHGTRHEAEPK